MERFIVFIRNNKTAEEFVASRRAIAGDHEIVMEVMKKRYPNPQYTVHTCYTDAELKDIIETISRWTGMGEQMTDITPPQNNHLLHQSIKPLSVIQNSSST